MLSKLLAMELVVMTVKTHQQLCSGSLSDFCQNDSRETFLAWCDDRLQLPNTGTHIGFVYSGTPILFRNAGEQEYKLHPGMYFSLPGDGWIGGENSSGFVVTCPTYRSSFNIGGEVELSGRFSYIDGGTDSLLIPPLMLGDPCLNALYFPPGTEQTAHTHPSYRLVMVVRGSGECVVPEGFIPLKPGGILLIPANYIHKFCTREDNLTVVTFHPDSDVGFTHQDHPMIKRTMVGGISASLLPRIQTLTLSLGSH